MKLKLVIVVLVCVSLIIGMIIILGDFFVEEKDILYNPATINTPKTSGPFTIKDDELVIHQNLFLIAQELKLTDKGNVIILSPGGQIYASIPFDGQIKSTWNKHFVPDLSRKAKICSLEDLTGTWKIIFDGTLYQPITFKILEEQVLTEAELSFREDGGVNPKKDFYQPIC